MSSIVHRVMDPGEPRVHNVDQHMRELVDLVDSQEPGMVVVRSWVTAANKQVDILPCDAAAGQKTLLALQVTTRSPMGAVAYETGGLLVDGGWLRVLGAGNPRLPRGLADWNGYPDGPHRLAQALLVGAAKLTPRGRPS